MRTCCSAAKSARAMTSLAYATQLFHSIPELLKPYKDICAVDTSVYPEYSPEDVFGGVP